MFSEIQSWQPTRGAFLSGFFMSVLTFLTAAALIASSGSNLDLASSSSRSRSRQADSQFQAEQSASQTSAPPAVHKSLSPSEKYSIPVPAITAEQKK